MITLIGFSIITTLFSYGKMNAWIQSVLPGFCLKMGLYKKTLL